ncbi:hypothetical protein DSO57_1002769 [Entomophthora muscae]|uniref:Uncharacterized protein n=1 Tax=Entomophthora muscae TaxID=34485 RepID=A0ACC2RNJ5_9FUNG|nr:hypothetical protein DSO57_1002769 [Entomophthora muscae]
MYTSMYYILTYFAGSFGRYNVHAKIFRWIMTVYPIVTALTGFQFANLLPYIMFENYYTSYYWLRVGEGLYNFDERPPGAITGKPQTVWERADPSNSPSHTEYTIT